MSNPFTDEDAGYLAVRSANGRFALWPVSLRVPDGWTVVHGEDSRQACLDHIAEQWTELRPDSGW